MPRAQPIRLVDAGTVPAVRSQALYHGLARALGAETPDTVVLATPAEPYVCVGFHQDLEAEVDTGWCAARGIPVLRRETGGGAVYLDRDQHFVQWIMRPESLPARVDRRYRLFCRPLVDTYRAFGIPAAARPPNDVHVDGRKIVGTGAARIGSAEVLVGNVIVAFESATMARLLRVPSAAFRDQVQRSLDRYMTTIVRETGAAPDRAAVLAAYVLACPDALGRELRPGGLTPAEEAAVAESERRLRSDGFRIRPGGRPRRGVKIHEDVHVVETVGRPGTAPAGVRFTARLRSGRIEEIAVSRGPDPLPELAARLTDVPLEPAPVASAVRSCLPDARAAEWVDAILDLEIS